MNSVHKTSNRHERGQSLVELAVTFPVILLILLGTIDFGMAIYSYLIIRDSAQEGATYGSINPSNILEIENRARYISPQEYDSLSFNPVSLTNDKLVKIEVVTTGDNCQGVTKGKANSLTVNITYDYPLIIPLAKPITGSNTIPLNVSVTNVIIQPVCKT